MWHELPAWDRYLVRVYAVALVQPDAVFCLESAAALLKLPVFGDPVTVHVLVAPTSAARLSAGVRAHRTAEVRTIVEVGGIAMTGPADTAVDLARNRHNAVGVAVADAALRLDRTVTSATLVAVNEGRSGSRGRNHARWPLANATELAGSTLESVSRAVAAWLGFPRPQLQVTFISDTGDEDRSDFLWRLSDGPLRQTGLIGESDGDLKYDGRFGDPRTVLRRQGVRDTRLRTNVRAIVHWGWVEATTVTPLRDILRGAGLRPITPEDTAQLFPLKRLLSSRAPHRTAAPDAERTPGGRELG